MGACPQCGAVAEGGSFCTSCGSSLTAPAAATAPVRRSVRPVWIIAAVLLLVVASAFTTVVVLRSTSGEAASSAVDASGAGTAAVSAAADAAGSSASPSSEGASVEPVAAAPLPLNPTVIVLDASGSMKQEDAPGPRIDAAKSAVRTLVDGLPDGAPVGLIVYGMSTDGSDEAKAAGCRDIKATVPLGPVDKASFGAAVDDVAASGYTPIGSSLRAAASLLPASGERNIVVVSDGEDTCAPPEPCDVAKEVAGNGLAIHTVGFRVSGAAKDQLTCIAQAGGGKYIDAGNAVQLQAFLRAAADPNVTVNTLKHDGFGDLTIGMSARDAKAVDPAIDPAESGTVVIVWRDCDLTFTDGMLTSIAPRTPIPTQDGLAVGDDVAKAVQLYESSAMQIDGGRTHAVFAVEPASELGYDVTFTPSAAGQLAGPITTIVLCRCLPAVAAVSDVDPSGYAKFDGRWWFRTPDDGWNCSISSTPRWFGSPSAYCESRRWTQNKDVSYPTPTDGDVAAADCGEIGLSGGLIETTPVAASYGGCGKGDGSEFVYERDKGVPGFGKILGDGEVLTAGGFRCFVTGISATCGPAGSSTVGFTVNQFAYQIYPRDGVPPAAGSADDAPDVIDPGGFGALRLGMSVDEVKQVDPTFVSTGIDHSGCEFGEVSSASLTFRPADGVGAGLARIRPTGTPGTTEGLRVGDSLGRAFDLYSPDGSRQIRSNQGYVALPVLPGSEINYSIAAIPPAGSDSTGGTFYDAGLATVGGISLFGPAECGSE